MSLRDILQRAGIRRALVVDDAYDQVPLATDLVLDGEAWTQFFEDLNEEDKARIETIFPAYRQTRGDELRSNDDFISRIWRDRATLRPELIAPLFSRYEADKNQDLSYLATLTNALTEFGLECNTSGRVFTEQAARADLIIVDLFLSSSQDRDLEGFLKSEGLIGE
jgi:hypothetical protein